MGIALGAAGIAAVVFGFRSLTADYLIRVASFARGGAHAGSRVRKPKLGAIVRRFFGGQPALAGFAFVSRMMLRDWQFRRQMIPLFVFPLVSIGSAFSSGWPADPLLRKFTPIHVMPHALGFLLLFVCTLMRFGNDYKGVWVFVSIPSGALDGFARGVHALLWLDGILIPNLIALPVLAWRWGIGHAALFIVYSIAATSVYLALELRLIENVPFSKQMDTSIQSLTLPLLLGCTARCGNCRRCAIFSDFPFAGYRCGVYGSAGRSSLVRDESFAGHSGGGYAIPPRPALGGERNDVQGNRGLT